MSDSYEDLKKQYDEIKEKQARAKAEKIVNDLDDRGWMDLWPLRVDWDSENQKRYGKEYAEKRNQVIDMIKNILMEK